MVKRRARAKPLLVMIKVMTGIYPEPAAFVNASILFILGDGIYPACRYIRTPYDKASNNIQASYNSLQEKLRKRIECVIGVVKKKWPALKEFRMRSLGDCSNVLYTCMILYSMAYKRIDWELEDNLFDEERKKEKEEAEMKGEVPEFEARYNDNFRIPSTKDTAEGLELRAKLAREIWDNRGNADV